MTYCLPDKCNNPSEFAEYQPWFKKSMADILRITEDKGFDIYKFYESQYSVKLYMNSFNVIERISFPSREDAVLFVLRWA